MYSHPKDSLLNLQILDDDIPRFEKLRNLKKERDFYDNLKKKKKKTSAAAVTVWNQNIQDKKTHQIKLLQEINKQEDYFGSNLQFFIHVVWLLSFLELSKIYEI